jgi:hypothetical protein
MAISASIPNAKCLAPPEALSNCWAKLQAGCAAPIRERQGCFRDFRDNVWSTGPAQKSQLRPGPTKQMYSKDPGPTREKAGLKCLFAAQPWVARQGDKPWQSPLVYGPGGIVTNMRNDLACHTTRKERKVSAAGTRSIKLWQNSTVPTVQSCLEIAGATWMPLCHRKGSLLRPSHAGKPEP